MSVLLPLGRKDGPGPLVGLSEGQRVHDLQFPVRVRQHRQLWQQHFVPRADRAREVLVQLAVQLLIAFTVHKEAVRFERVRLQPQGRFGGVQYLRLQKPADLLTQVDGQDALDHRTQIRGPLERVDLRAEHPPSAGVHHPGDVELHVPRRRDRLGDVAPVGESRLPLHNARLPVGQGHRLAVVGVPQLQPDAVEVLPIRLHVEVEIPEELQFVDRADALADPLPNLLNLLVVGLLLVPGQSFHQRVQSPAAKARPVPPAVTAAVAGHPAAHHLRAAAAEAAAEVAQQLRRALAKGREPAL